ncbi:MAG: CCA tRNA nucleotidyltransferase, partial [Oscillospiraceae bacterium]
MQLPENAKLILDLLEKNGFKAYIVGGFVRDSLMGVMSNDCDITTNATPKQIIDIFSDYKVVETGIKHGTVTVIINKTGYEITTYRIDGKYLDNRKPNQVVFTAKLEDDLKRRDFTINAMAYNKTIVDIFGGAEDINNKIVRCVGNPYERFKEDALRILRALRFAATLDFYIENKTLMAIKECTPLLKNLSKERITSEVFGMLGGNLNNLPIEPFLFLGCKKNNIGLAKKSNPDILVRFVLLGFDLSFFSLTKIQKEQINLLNKYKNMPFEKADIFKRLNILDKELCYKLIEIKEILEEKSYSTIKKEIDSIIFHNTPYRISQLDINGNDLIDIGCPIGKFVGNILEEILDKVESNIINNNKNEILEYVILHKLF